MEFGISRRLYQYLLTGRRGVEWKLSDAIHLREPVRSGYPDHNGPHALERYASVSNSPTPFTQIKGACPHNCPDTCGWVVTVNEAGTPVKIQGDPDHPYTRG